MFSILLINNVRASNDTPEQIVRLLTNKDKVYKNEEFQLIAQYDVSDGKKTTGIGIKIYYDSRCFELIDSDCYDTSNSGIISIPLNKKDTKNDDDDVNTDYSVAIGWLTFTQIWPAEYDPPFTMMTLTFRVKSSTTNINSNFNVTATSEDINYRFAGKNCQIQIMDSSIGDINKDGKVNLVDIIKMIQFLSTE
jgi:hypothetical protein